MRHRLAIGGEQNCDPTSRWKLRQYNHDHHGERCGEKRADDAPDQSPDRKREQHDDCGKVQRLAGHSRLNKIADHELPDADPSEDSCDGAERRKLHERNGRREDDGDDRSDGWDVVQEKIRNDQNRALSNPMITRVI